MKKKKKTRTGVSLPPAAAALLLVCSLLPAGAQKPRKDAEAAAVISGTVFRDSGLALPGAAVRLEPEQGGQSKHKLKKTETVANTRGEFALRVPAVPGRYKLTVRAPGYQPQEKPVAIQGPDSVEIFFLLEPVSRTSKK